MLFELIAGQVPYRGANLMEIVDCILMESVPSLRRVHGWRRVSRKLGALVSKALAKAADDRFASAAEMIAALRKAVPDAAEYDAPFRY